MTPDLRPTDGADRATPSTRWGVTNDRKVELAMSWLSCFRRLQVRWDRDAGRWFAFVLVACALVCFNRL